MYIKRETKMTITDEEREILNRAREILMDFENESSVTDENILQEMYEEYVTQTHNTALPTAIDLLTIILGDND